MEIEKREKGKVLRKVLKTVLIIQVSLIAIGLIYFLFINTDNTVYKVLSSPVWGSLGAFVTAAGVFLGAKLGLKSAFELEKRKTAAEAKVKWQAFKREVLLNAETIKKVHTCLYFIGGSPASISPKTFDTIKIAISHIKRGAWEEFLKVNTSEEFGSGEYNTEILVACFDYEYALNNAIRDIEMKISEYERISEHPLVEKKSIDRFSKVREDISIKINDVLKAKEKVFKYLFPHFNEPDYDDEI